MGTLLALFVIPVLHTYTDEVTPLVRTALRRVLARPRESPERGR
jgi:hypothetical protein